MCLSVKNVFDKSKRFNISKEKKKKYEFHSVLIY